MYAGEERFNLCCGSSALALRLFADVRNLGCPVLGCLAGGLLQPHHRSTEARQQTTDHSGFTAPRGLIFPRHCGSLLSSITVHSISPSPFVSLAAVLISSGVRCWLFDGQLHVGSSLSLHRLQSIRRHQLTGILSETLQ
jgi:hypothetical protein